MASHNMKIEPLHVPKPEILPLIDDPNYYCRSCKHQFATKYTYKVHLVAVHQLKLDVSQRAQKLNQNNLVPLVDDPNHYCQACNHRFVNRQSYGRHLMLAHSLTPKPVRPVPNPNILPVIDDPNHYCRSCKHQFVNRYIYGSHLVIVHKMKLKPLVQKNVPVDK
jgi:ribosomal protein L37AE/L43A